jgi:hypothetical protein
VVVVEEEEDMELHDGMVLCLTSGSAPSARITMRKQCCLAQMMSFSNLDLTWPVYQGAYRNLSDSVLTSVILPFLEQENMKRPNSVSVTGVCLLYIIFSSVLCWNIHCSSSASNE